MGSPGLRRTLAVGEKKRVAMAGVIAMEPQALVLDEPWAGLDPQGVRDLTGSLNSLCRDYGMTVIFSTHDVSLVPELAYSIYVMHRGRIVAEGSIGEIFAHPEKLRSIRLDVPPIPKLLQSLREQGIEISMAYSYAEAEKALLSAFRKRS